MVFLMLKEDFSEYMCTNCVKLLSDFLIANISMLLAEKVLQVVGVFQFICQLVAHATEVDLVLCNYSR